jgi:hypothetical protein
MMKPGQNQVLYALYGVVEHSGTLHGGHYVAYVKVRPVSSRVLVKWLCLVLRDNAFICCRCVPLFRTMIHDGRSSPQTLRHPIEGWRRRRVAAQSLPQGSGIL